MDWLEGEVNINRGYLLLFGLGAIAAAFITARDRQAAAEMAFNAGCAYGYGVGVQTARATPAQANAQPAQLPAAQPQQPAPQWSGYQPPEQFGGYGWPWRGGPY